MDSEEIKQEYVDEYIGVGWGVGFRESSLIEILFKGREKSFEFIIREGRFLI